MLFAHDSCWRRAKHSLDMDPSALRARDGARLDVGAVYEGGLKDERGTEQRAMGRRLRSAVGKASKATLSSSSRSSRSSSTTHDARRARVQVSRLWEEGSVGGS